MTAVALCLETFTPSWCLPGLRSHHSIDTTAGNLVMRSAFVGAALARAPVVCALGFALAMVGHVPAAKARELEAIEGGCGSGNVIHVFRRYFTIDGPTQLPTGPTGDAIVVARGQSNLWWNLESRRFRWYCGEPSASLAGFAGEIAGQVSKRACESALAGSPVAAICPGAAYAVQQFVQGLLGNWEADRCPEGTAAITIQYKRDGDIIWRCQSERAPVTEVPAPAPTPAPAGTPPPNPNDPLLLALAACFAGGGDPLEPLENGCIERVLTGIGRAGFFNIEPLPGSSAATLRAFATHSVRRVDPSRPEQGVGFVLSELPVTQAQVNAYNFGGQFSSVGPILLSPPGVPCGGTPNCFENPRVAYGPMIQLPLAGTWLSLVFDPVYKRVRLSDGTVVDYRYRFTPRADDSGGLRLTRDAFCAIWSLSATRWDDPRLTSANGGVPLWPSPDDPDPQSGLGRDIVLVARDDDSLATALLTRRLRAVCPAYGTTALPAGFALAFPGNPGPNTASIATPCERGQTNTLFPGRWAYARGDEGMAECIRVPRPSSTPGTIRFGGALGYATPAATRPFSRDGLHTVTLQNAAGNFVPPGEQGVAATLALQPVPPAVDRADPLKWVPALSGADPLARWIADPAGPAAYPLVGLTNIVLYTCYARSEIAEGLVRTGRIPGFLNWVYGNSRSVQNLLAQTSQVPVAEPVRRAVLDTFARPSDPLGLNLFVRPTSAGGSIGCTTGAL
jgi:hypothetical protein